jgi:Fe-S cluster assembly protein SufD
MNDTTLSSTRVDSPLARSWAERLDQCGTAGERPGWLGTVRAEAAAAFLQHGLPGNKDEVWKYTSLRRLESLAPSIREHAGDPGAMSWSAPLEHIGGYGFRWLDGRVDLLEAPLPDGVTVLRLEEALDDGAHGLADRLRGLFESVDVSGRSRAFEALNTAFLGPGVVIHVQAGVDAGRCQAQWGLPDRAEPGLHNVRLCVLLERGARIRLLEQFGLTAPSGAEGRMAQALNLLLQADLAEGSAMEHVRVQDQSHESVLLTSTDVRQAGDSRYAYSGFDLGGGLVRHAITCRLDGPGAQAEVNGALVLDGERHVDYHVCADHRAPGCRSEQFFRGVLGGRSRGVFNGKAVIRAGADGSRARQSNANLLLSREAEMDTKPELEIYADEVEASHGATVGQLDETAVFYLRSRGLSQATARRMLTTAFCRAVADRLDDRELAGPIADLLERAMPDTQPGSGDAE